MKTMAMVMAGLVALGVATPRPAQAINEEWAAVAGFVGGVLFSEASRCDRTVVVERPVVERRVVHRPVVIERPEPCGYWEVRRVKVWVPGSWTYIDLGCNRYRKVWNEGYYRWESQRVWVETSSRHHRGYVRR